MNVNTLTLKELINVNWTVESVRMFQTITIILEVAKASSKSI